MRIAITAYIENYEKFVEECNLMTFSGQGLDERFEFVLFVHPNMVQHVDTHSNVRVIPYTPPDTQYYRDYGFAKSLVFVYDEQNVDVLREYDYIIKTDTDVIFTLKMNTFPFEQNNITVGLGHYWHPTIEEDMTNIAIRFGYPNFKRITDMHSTIICPTEDIIDIMRRSDDLCREMYYGLEEDGEWGVSIWRGVVGGTSGVCSMYAAEIVITALYPHEQIVVTDLVDGGSDWSRDSSEFYHYHCYHHDNIYSKFEARRGRYLYAAYRPDDSSASYCLNVYLSRRDYSKLPDTTIHPLFIESPAYSGVYKQHYW